MPTGGSLADAVRTGDGVITITYTDAAGPVAAPTQSPPANAAGWNNSPVTVAWNWSDDGAGIDTANCTATSTSTGDGVQTLTASCVDLADNTVSAEYDVQVDTGAPAATIVSPTSTTYVQGDSVLADYACTDTVSGISSCVGPVPDGDPIDTSTLGPVSFTLTATDVAGNTVEETVEYTVVERDLEGPVAAPTQSPLANGAGWNDSPVTVTWNWSDSGSGIDAANCTATSTSSGEGEQTLTATCADLEGNATTADYTVRVDESDPTITIDAPQATTYTQGAVVAADYTCTDTVSGISSCVGPVPDGDPIDTSTLGPVSFTVTATDVAGNTVEETVEYTVVDLEGPVAAPTQSPLANARGLERLAGHGHLELV